MKRKNINIHDYGPKTGVGTKPVRPMPDVTVRHDKLGGPPRRQTPYPARDPYAGKRK